MKNLYEKIGGSISLEAAVDKLYDKLLEDKRIKHFFDGIDMDKQRQHQKEFLKVAFKRLDGLAELSDYYRMSLQTAHADLVKNMGLNDSHFDAFLEDLVAAFEELSIDPQLTKEVCTVMESMRNEVLNRAVFPKIRVEEQISELITHLQYLLNISAYSPDIHALIAGIPHTNRSIRLKETQKIKVFNANDVYNIMQKVLLWENKIERDKEHFWIIGLNADNQILFIELVSLGGIKSTVVEPISVFRVAVLKNAVKAILVHNHPSGALEPSEADKDITDRLMQVGQIIDVPVIDHLIISTEGFYSFKDEGLYDELKTSMKWLPPDEIIRKTKAEEQKIRQEAIITAKEEGLDEGLAVGESRGKEKGMKVGIEKGKIEVARALKQRGIDSKIIAETSGLSVNEIDKL